MTQKHDCAQEFGVTTKSISSCWRHGAAKENRFYPEDAVTKSLEDLSAFLTFCNPPDHQAASYFDWRINLESKGRALLMLFLFSDVTELDAPTRIRVGSHLRVARLLSSAGQRGMSFMEVAQALDAITHDLQETTATGMAGTVYLCHPFLAHAVQRHRGNTPRFMAQPPLYPKVPFNLARSDEDYSLVERATMLGLR